MTIAERKAREARDRENPWRSLSSAKADGTICELRFNDMAGDFPVDHHYFLDSDGEWYRISPPEKVSWPRPIEWRPAYVQLTPERRSYIKRQSEQR